MAITNQVRKELSAVADNSKNLLYEAIAMIRVAMDFDFSEKSDTLVISLENEFVAKRLWRTLTTAFANEFSFKIEQHQTRSKKNARVLVVVENDAVKFLDKIGLLNNRHMLVDGLPTDLIFATKPQVKAVLRGVIMARGVIIPPSSGLTFDINLSSPVTAMAVSGLFRLLNMKTPKVRIVRGKTRLSIRDGESVETILRAVGATTAANLIEEESANQWIKASANRAANCDEANSKRSAEASVDMSARLEKALQILGNLAPEHLAAAAKLRIDNPVASLDELAKMMNPPMSKNAFDGRLRRLVIAAEKVKEENSAIKQNSENGDDSE